MRIDRIAPSLWTRVRRWLRRGAGAVERAGLENRNTRKRIVGSNPTLSATNICNILIVMYFIIFIINTHLIVLCTNFWYRREVFIVTAEVGDG